MIPKAFQVSLPGSRNLVACPLLSASTHIHCEVADLVAEFSGYSIDFGSQAGRTPSSDSFLSAWGEIAGTYRLEDVRDTNSYTNRVPGGCTDGLLQSL